IWDAKEPGLVLPVQPSGHKAFKVVYTLYGRAWWYHVGWIGLNDARKIAAQVRLKVARGKNPAAERRAERSAATFDGPAERSAITAVRNFTADRRRFPPGTALANRPIIYFAAVGSAYIKIGFSTNLDVRLRNLQAGSAEKIGLAAVFPGNRRLEKQFHQK